MEGHEAAGSEVLEDIREIMGTSDPILLFGANEKRARIRYRRLMRSVHPDMSHGTPGADEATIRLNALWDAYRGMTNPGEGDARRTCGTEGPEAHHPVHEIARTGRFVLFSEPSGWLVVDRNATGAPRPTARPDLARLADILSGSPVMILDAMTEKEIRQADGFHHAIACPVPEFHAHSHRVLSLSDMKGHVPNGTTEAEDIAWLLKRCLFLVAAMAKAGVAPARGTTLDDIVMVDADAHMLMVVAPHELALGSGSVDEQRESLQSLVDPLMRMTDVADGRRESRRLMAFMRGIDVDRVTETADLFDELGDLLGELFGTPRFHRMRIV